MAVDAGCGLGAQPGLLTRGSLFPSQPLCMFELHSVSNQLHEQVVQRDEPGVQALIKPLLVIS